MTTPSTSQTQETSRQLLVHAFAERMEGGILHYQIKPSSEREQACDKSNEATRQSPSAEDSETPCPVEGHTADLHQSLYREKCGELRVKANSGVLAWLSGSKRCLCQQDAG